MEQAIKLAQEGGWKGTSIPEPYSPLLAMAFLDPLFWQALGKAMGWEVITYKDQDGSGKDWLYHWHRFIDHLAEGKDAESFFNDLLKHE